MIERATPMTVHVAARVRDLRKAQGMTHQDVADHVALTVPTFSRSTCVKLENGNRRCVSVEELVALASALNVDISDLVPAQRPPDWSGRLQAMARQLQDVSELLRGVVTLPEDFLTEENADRFAAKLAELGD